MISNHLTTRVSVIALVAGFTAACGDSGDGSEVTSEATSPLTAAVGTTKSTSLNDSLVRPVPPPVTVVRDPTAGPIGCSTLDGNVRLPDGTIGSLAQNNTWPSGVVPFRFHPSVQMGSNTEFLALQAIRHYNFMTPLRFVFDADSSHDDHVLFRNDGKTCVTTVGYTGGAHEINLEVSGCDFFDTFVHEVGHSVGLHHEHQRPDRDQFILIQDGKVHGGISTVRNIKNDNLGQFDVYQGPGYRVGGFDFDSVMLFPAITRDPTFALDINKPIITKRDGSAYANPQEGGGLSSGDAATLFQLYPPPVLLANADNTCQTAPPRRSTLPTSTGTVFPKRSELLAVRDDAGTGAFSQYPSTGSSFLAPSSWGTAGSFQSHAPWAAGDFNKDGLTDIAEIRNVGGLSRVVVRTASGSALNTPRIWADRAGLFEHSRQWLPGDFTGDGLDDLAVIWHDGDMTTFTIFRSTGDSFGEPEHFNIQDVHWDEQNRWLVGDFNHDGKADLAGIWNLGGTTTIAVRISTGSKFLINLWATNLGPFEQSTRWLAGDFSGDGSTDLVSLGRDGTHTVARVFVSNSANNSFATPVEWLSFIPGFIPQPLITGTLSTATSSTTTTTTTARQILPTLPDSLPPLVTIDPDPPAMASARWTAGDFDDDGLADLASVWDNGGTNVITVLKSTGSSFTKTHWGTSGMGSYIPSTQWCAGRFRSPIVGGETAP